MADDVLRTAQRLAEQRGWTYVRRSKHGFIFRRGDQFTSMSTSPGDHRALRNFEARLRRAT